MFIVKGWSIVLSHKTAIVAKSKKKSCVCKSSPPTKRTRIGLVQRFFTNFLTYSSTEGPTNLSCAN
jgi:hypothetical protein